MCDRKFPKKLQIEIILDCESFKRLVRAVRSMFEIDSNARHPLRGFTYDALFDITEVDLIDTVGVDNIDDYCDHLHDRGEGVCIYKNNENRYTYSIIDRGDEEILGVYDSLDEVAMALMRRRLQLFKNAVNASTYD